MGKAAQIRSLTHRAFQTKDPVWTRKAIEAHKRAGIDDKSTYFACSEFGRSWDAMKILREQCLPEFKGKRKTIKVLEIGIGEPPHFELFELFDHLMRAGIAFDLSALEVNPSFLQTVKGVKSFYPRLSLFDVPRSYYGNFLGKPVVDIYNHQMFIPREVTERIRLLQGDIAAVRLPQASFDIIVCLNVLRYLKAGLAQALAVLNMAEGLRSDGFLVTDKLTGDGRWNWLNERTLAHMGFSHVQKVDLERLRPIYGRIVDMYEQHILQKT